MEKKKVSIPLSFAIIWMVAIMVMLTLKVSHHFKIGIFLNIFFIMAVVAVSMFFQIKNEKKLYPFASNFKNSLKKSGTYMILITIFLFCYFKFINPSFLGDLKESRLKMELAKDWNQVKASSPVFEEMTREEFVEKATSSNELLSSISLNLSFYFLGMFFMSLFFSILIPIFYKKIVLRM